MGNRILYGVLVLLGLGIILFFGYRMYDKKTPPVNMYAPNLSAGLLKGDFDPEDVAELLKMSSSLTPPEVPFLKLRAELRYKPEFMHMGNPIKYTRVIHSKLPDRFIVSEGEPGNHWATLHIRSSKEDYTCLYQGNGEEPSTEKCENNGDYFQFVGCMDTSDFQSKCADPKTCFESARNWKFNTTQAKDDIRGQEFTLTLHGSDNCTTKIESDTAFTKIEEYPYCGDRIGNKVTLKRDLDCSEHQGPALFVEGAFAELDGAGHSIKTSYPIGIIVRGRDNSIKNLTLQGDGVGYGLLFENTEKIQLENIKFQNWWVGIELFGSSIEPEAVDLSFDQISKEPMRKR